MTVESATSGVSPGVSTLKDGGSVGRPLAERVRLQLGCGRKYDPNAVNVDVSPALNPDVVHNLERMPWPFPDNRFTSVEMRDVLEHLGDTLGVMEEIHRVCKGGARVEIIVPHFSSNGAFTDPTHKRFFSAATFDYFTEGHPQNFYTRVRFRRERAQIVFRPTLMNKLVWRIANRYPVAYENHWAWRFPAWFVDAQLIVLK